MKYYAGIGSRETPPDVLKRMTKLAGILERKGYCLRSGGAEGADKAFGDGVKDEMCNADIYLASQPIPLWCSVFTEHFHPAPHNLKEYPWKLMSRNAMQILGRDGNTPIEFVVCWTKGGKEVGGTAQAIKIAKFFDIPVYNFYNEKDIEALKERINNGTNK